MQNSYNNQPPVFAGFWVRMAAYLIDSVIVFFGLLFVRLIMSGVMSLADGTVLGGNILFDYTLKDIVIYLCGVIYFVLCTYFTGTTLGKKAMNLRVVNEDGSHKLCFLNIVFRETVGRFLSSVILWVGYIMVGIDKEKRGLHDILCDTRVVYEKPVKVYPVYQGMPVPPGRPVPPERPVPPVYTMPVPDRNEHREEIYAEGNSENETTGL